MPTAVLTATVSYTAPGPTAVQSVFQVSSAYQASSVGFVDVPSGTADAAAFNVPLGTVTTVKGILIQNNCAQQLNVRMNGAVADEWSVAPGGVFMPSFGATGVLDDPITEIELVTTALTDADGTIGYMVFGDE